jgi:hypothetical protein
MIGLSVNWASLLGDFRDLAKSYKALPAHIGKKHLLAGMRRAIKNSGGETLLRRNTPPTGVTRGRRKKGVAARSTGKLRRAVTTKARWIGRNADGWAVAGLGYKYGPESMKAIWQEFGTTRMAGRHMMERTYEQIKGAVAARLSYELAQALEKATKEVASGKNKGYQG